MKKRKKPTSGLENAKTKSSKEEGDEFRSSTASTFYTDWTKLCASMQSVAEVFLVYSPEAWPKTAVRSIQRHASLQIPRESALVSTAEVVTCTARAIEKA